MAMYTTFACWKPQSLDIHGSSRLGKTGAVAEGAASRSRRDMMSQLCDEWHEGGPAVTIERYRQVRVQIIRTSSRGVSASPHSPADKFLALRLGQG